MRIKNKLLIFTKIDTYKMETLKNLYYDFIIISKRYLIKTFILSIIFIFLGFFIDELLYWFFNFDHNKISKIEEILKQIQENKNENENLLKKYHGIKQIEPIEDVTNTLNNVIRFIKEVPYLSFFEKKPQ